MGIDEELREHLEAITGLVRLSSGVIEDVAKRLSEAFLGGGKLLVCGNGGSAADAQHMAAEFVNRMRMDRAPLPAVALTTDSSILTCVANDACYESVFSRQVEALGRSGDGLFALSTSGASGNILQALACARALGLFTVGFTGRSGAERLDSLCDIVVAVPSDDCARIQECHEFACHLIAGMVEERVFCDGRVLPGRLASD